MSTSTPAIRESQTLPLHGGGSPRGLGAGREGVLTRYRGEFQARAVGSDPRARPTGLQAPGSYRCRSPEASVPRPGPGQAGT